MIRTLVVGDDYHVAHAHALSVGRVPGFSVVGEAHSAEDARQLINDEHPDLLLLDMYLPDYYNGLDLVRRLTRESAESDEPGHVPDFRLVTAARDIESVRSAMQRALLAPGASIPTVAAPTELAAPSVLPAPVPGVLTEQLRNLTPTERIKGRAMWLGERMAGVKGRHLASTVRRRLTR